MKYPVIESGTLSKQLMIIGMGISETLWIYEF